MTQTKPKMSFSSPEFAKAAESLSTRSANLSTATQRSTTIGMNDFNNSQRSAADTSNYALSSNPLVQRSIAEDNRNFREDARRFDAGLGFKNSADSRANETQRFGVSASLEGAKYNADAGVRSTQIGADAQVKSTGLNADAAKYGADRNVDVARIGADANRFSALLGAGTATLNSQQYRPSFNR